MRFRFITLSLHLAALLAFAVLPSCDKDPLNSGTTNSGNNGNSNGGNGGSGNDGGYTAEEGLAKMTVGTAAAATIPATIPAASPGETGAAATTAATRPRRAWPMSLTEAVSREYTSQ